MHKIYPEAGGGLDLLGLAEAYAFPSQQARWVRASMVSSADGAAYVAGRSAGLSSPDDMNVFGIQRMLCDAVLVGAGTARAEEYKAVRRRPSLLALRQGRPDTATIALVSRSLGLNLASPLFADAAPDARTIVITCAASDPELRAETAKAADVIVAGDETVDLAAALDALAGRGLTRVVCEGGPHLLADLTAAGLLDELCLTLSPTLAGPGASRIVAGAAQADLRRLALRQLLAGDDGFLFARYVATEEPQR